MSRILYVAFPMVKVDSAVAGGAEQMLGTLEREIAARGFQTTVAACAGSQFAGQLFATGEAPEIADAYEQRKAEHEAAVLAEIARARHAGQAYDLVHDKSGSFWMRAAETDATVLATLHLPRSFYPAQAFASVPPNLFFNCVSGSQLRTFNDLPQVLGAIANGVRGVDFPPPADHRENYLLWIGRVCEEKGPHVAIDVAKRIGLPLILAGQVHAYSYHQRYFERSIAPRLDEQIRFIPTPNFWEKLRLLRHARALLVPSLVDETSSLVAMEAGACGTPVVAFRRGAIPEVVQDSVTGFVVDNAEEMAAAVARTGNIDSHACREHILRNFSSARMAQEYGRLYEQMISAAKGKERAAA